MKAKEVGAVFEEIAPIEIGEESDREREDLGFRFGNPEIDVTGIGVAWYLAVQVIKAAIEKRLNLLFIHEPILFWENRNPWHTWLRAETNPINLEKKRLLTNNNICVYVAHSTWDLQQEIGMQPTFAKALGLDNEIKRDGVVRIYEVETMCFSNLIHKVKTVLSLNHVWVQGREDKLVKKIAVGFGYMGYAVDAILVNGADAGIFGELNEFSFIAARDSDLGIIETTHLVSESIGFRSAAHAMKERLPEMIIEFLEVPFAYKWA